MTQLSLFPTRPNADPQVEPQEKKGPASPASTIKAGKLESRVSGKPEPSIYTPPPRPDEPFWRAHTELTATLLGLQTKMGWPAYQTAWEKAQTAILASYEMNEADFYRELRKRLEDERNLARPKEDE